MYSARLNILELANAVDIGGNEDSNRSCILCKRFIPNFSWTECLTKCIAKKLWLGPFMRFYQKFQFPGVLGCIDGTRVAILRPHIHEERYYNRKGFHSLNVMIICDAELNISCVDASSPGSAHDSSVWQGHPLYHHLKQISEDTGEQVFLLGDSGWYPLRKTLITPILNTVDGTPQPYYTKHITARSGALYRRVKSPFQDETYEASNFQSQSRVNRDLLEDPGLGTAASSDCGEMNKLED